MHRVRPAVLALLALLLAPLAAAPGLADEAVELPKPLGAYGFGDPQAPLRVEFVGPVGEDADHPRLVGTKDIAPANTLWVFRDPGPVLAILAKARTRTFARDRFPAAIARLRIDASTDTVRRVIHLHYRPGHGDISVRKGEGAYQGGGWTFDASADRALVALLSRTKPTALGAPMLGILQARRAEPVPGNAPRVFTIESAAAYAKARESLLPRYPRMGWEKLPQGFDWATHRLVGVELPAGIRGQRLDWSGARIRGGVLTWRVRKVAEDRVAPTDPRSGFVLLGVFPRHASVTRVRALFDDGTEVETPLGR